MVKIPTAIVFGFAGGILAGRLLRFFFAKCTVRNDVKLLLILCVPFILVTMERGMTGVLGFSGLLAVMALGGSVEDKQAAQSKQLSEGAAQLWAWAEPLKERLFAACAYIPKATVQAAIGGLPLAMGLACGELLLTLAVLSILLTAPLGAALIDMGYPRLLQREERAQQ